MKRIGFLVECCLYALLAWVILTYWLSTFGATR